MDIMLNIGRNGQVGLTCDGVFDSLIEGVELFYESGQLALKFADAQQPVLLNCPIDLATIDMVSGQDICAIGFFLGRELAGAVYVPFTVNYQAQADGVDQQWQRLQ